MMFGGVTCKLFPSREGYKDNRLAEGIKNNTQIDWRKLFLHTCKTLFFKQNESTSKLVALGAGFMGQKERFLRFI